MGATTGKARESSRKPRRLPLEGRHVCLCGRFASMSRGQFAALVRRMGGRVGRLTEGTDLLVVGRDRLPLREDGRLAGLLERAREFQDRGFPLEVIGEQRLLERLGLAGREETGPQRLYTTAQLSRILGVPGARIRGWVRRGIIRPVRTVHRLHLFDFRQVAEAQMLRRLLDAGVALSRIRRTLELLRRWVPETEATLTRLARLEADRRLAVRLGDGGLAEPSGQLRLPFGPSAPRTAVGPEEWLERAAGLEEAECYAEAVRAYERALLAGAADAETYFRLGNLLFALERYDEARRRFVDALERDPHYVEAWNNLASVLGELGLWERAVHAARRAVDLAPGFADAHYNLALALAATGRLEDARHHARIYLAHDATSEWAAALRDLVGPERT